MKKAISTVLVLVLVFCGLCGCGKEPVTVTSSETSAPVSSQTTATSSQVESTVGGGGAKPLVNTVFAHYEGQYPKIECVNLEGREGWSAKVVIKDLKGKTVFEESGIKTNNIVVKAKLTPGQEYKVYIYYKSPKGEEGLFGGIYSDGIKVIYNKPQGKYYFDGGISLDVLNNYLNRAMTYCHLRSDSMETLKQSFIDTGVKYVQRADCAWVPQPADYAQKTVIKNKIDALHELDPDIIFEACIFEYIDKNVNNIAIPAETFEAFGLPVEKRNFSYDKMIFPDGHGVNQWGKDKSVPDITQLETQMFFYHRAVFFIDLGFEALHLGQAKLIGKNDTNNECWTKIMGMMRDYAKENARRHYVILDAHYPGQKFFDKNGNSLVDFNAYPTRMKVADGQTDHVPSEKNPQKCVIKPGMGDSIYGIEVRSTAPAGWYTNNFPYLVEIDNYGVASESNQNLAKSDIWGFDEITWFAIQPQWYRHEFTEYLVTEIDSFEENGHMAVVGKRWPQPVKAGKGATVYFAAKKDGDVNYHDDLTFIKDMWKRLGK